MSATPQLSRATEMNTDAVSRPKARAETVGLLRTLLQGDEQEQRETFSFLKQALDEDRPASRKLFPSP
jgi:hypothetical protein